MKQTAKDVVAKAKQLAINKHKDQLYRSDDNPLPYRWHVEHVAELAKRMGYPDEVIAAGWLHDVVEDTNLTLEQLSTVHGFNELVVNAVSAVTFVDGKDTDKIGKAKSDMLGHVVKFCDASVNYSASVVFGPKENQTQAGALDKYFSYMNKLKKDLPTVKEVTEKVKIWHKKND